MATVAAVSRQRSKTKSLAFVGLTVAIMVVSAWVTIPIGPVPITLQIFAVAFAIMLLSPKEAIAAVYCYELLGAIGLPVFSAQPLRMLQALSRRRKNLQR